MSVYEDLRRLKLSELETGAEEVKDAMMHPHLRQLFFEVTSQCNLACKHCGSSCTMKGRSGVPVEILENTIIELEVDPEYKNHMPFIVLTGGEPMMRSDIRAIVDMLYAHHLPWGMTTNGTLVTAEDARYFVSHGMYSVAVSIDGTKEYHDAFRGVEGCFDKAFAGLQHFIDAGVPKSNVTTVLNHVNIKDINEIYEIVSPYDIDSWRLLSLEPIGRARGRKDLLLDPDDYIFIMNYIIDMRRNNIPVEYGCMHYLGLTWEREVRDWYWYCGAGIEVASIMANGDIGACLDIERNSTTIQGNIYEDDFLSVWRKKFQIFRHDLAKETSGCDGCEHAKYCRGGAHHTYDHVLHEQRLCMKGVLFD